jgi:hypothetical protein
MKTAIYIFAFFFLCSNIYAQKLPAKQLIVGSGGGVTGQTKSYILLENGQLYLKNSIKPDSLVLIRTVWETTAKKFYTQAQKLNLAKIKFNEPGNMSYFVMYQESLKKGYTVTWGKNKISPPKEVKAFYDSFLKALVK